MTFGFLSGSRNFCKLRWVSCEVLFLHGYAWIHWVARSCTTTAYRWLFRDSQPSLRTLWSAVIKSPIFSARRTASPVRFLQGALVVLVLIADVAVSVLREVSTNTVLARYHFSSCTRRTRGCVPVSWNIFIHKILRKVFQPFWQITQRISRAFSLSPFLFVFFVFCRFMRRVSPYCYSCSHFLLMRDAPWELLLPAVLMSGDVGVSELEERVDEPGTTIGTLFSVPHFTRLPSLMSCGFWPLVHS